VTTLLRSDVLPVEGVEIWGLSARHALPIKFEA
jgi:hypothetical protein